MIRHYLQPLFAPRSVALVGASERPGSLGEIVLRNLSAGGALELYAVNPKHQQVQGRKSYSGLAALPARPDLAVVATPARTVPGIVRDAAAAGIRAVLILTSGFGESGPEGQRLQDETLALARKAGIRILGPNCLGIMRTTAADYGGLNATFARTAALPGKLALISQSGAICGAILDWARGAHIGFTSVVSLGGAIDVDFGEVLDFLVADPATEAILLYVEGIRDARRYLSALRVAARVKPVIALKVGRYASGSKAASSHTGALVGSDEVFDAALRRGGCVRVKTYTQLFAAARLLSSGRLPKGERLAIVTNGGGPGVVAADSAAENGVTLASLSSDTISFLDEKLPPQWSHANPIDIIGDAPAQRFGDATAAALKDPNVDAVLAMYSPVAVTDPADAARAVAEAAKGSSKAVLGAWLGDINPNESRVYLDAQGIPNFYTPENAIEAFGFVRTYRRNQAQLLEVPPAGLSAFENRVDLDRAEAIRSKALGEKRSALSEHETKALLAAFGVPVPKTVLALNREEAMRAASDIGFPAVIKIHSPDLMHK
ncbi:MAG: acetate--CoA ligase family protein, partial [Clostridia bacterium]